MSSGKWHGGKGDRRRRGADDDKYRIGWDRIFGNGSKQNDSKEKDRQ